MCVIARLFPVNLVTTILPAFWTTQREQAPLIDSNLSPIIFRNGSLLGLWRNDDDRGSIHVCTASDWRDPSTYVMHTADIFSSPSDGGLRGIEDPYLWQASDWRSWWLYIYR